MTTTLLRDATDLHSQLRLAVSTVLRMSPAQVRDDAPFSSLGLDSLGAAELTAEIEDLTGISLSPEAVYEHSTVAALARFIDHGSDRGVTPFQRMRDDAVLPDDIRLVRNPPRSATRMRDARNILLTGATGFLGAHLLRTLLDETDARLLCLVRHKRGSETPEKRLLHNLTRYGVQVTTERVVVVEGDLGSPRLGLTRSGFDALAEDTDAIVHGGAQVDWVRGYEGLRDVNVLGTREILRLACRGTPKPLHFISSLGVCHSSLGPRAIDEGCDALPQLEGLRLGYAQSKCIAESLVREAGKRGLPVSIVRPALVSGDSVDGRSNVDDLLTRFIAGCVSMRAAPDLDWRVDCLPVDHVAHAIVRFALDHASGTDVVHISAKQPRHWRECVLWMRLCGYEIDLLPYREWLDRLGDEATVGHPLHPLRSFFLQPVAGENGLTLPEVFEESRRARVRDERSRERLRAVGACCSTIDTALLDRYFGQYVAEGVVSDVGRRFENESSPATPDISALRPELERALAKRFDDPSLSIEGVTLAPMGGEDSIVSELTSWREGSSIGLFRADLALRGAKGSMTTRVVVKVKPSDESVLEVAESVAALASPAVGREYACFREYHGFTRCHVRELALYRESDARIREHSPALLALSPECETQQLTLILEEIPASALFHAGEADIKWSPTLLGAAVDGAAAIHSVWFGRETELMAQPWLAPVRDSARLAEMRPLWSALADHACSHSPAWRDAELVRTHRSLVERVSEWSVPLNDLPRTLIHNDFNPRNIGIRTEGEPRLCAFDWELATIGLPQRDFAELLCWTLDASTTREEVAQWLERSRVQLAAATGVRIHAGDWELGFRAALAELLVDRLAMYAVVDRFRPQRYLPRVVRTWTTLHRYYPWGTP